MTVVERKSEVVTHMYTVTDDSAGADETFTVIKLNVNHGKEFYTFCLDSETRNCVEYLHGADEVCHHIESVHKYIEEEANAWDNFREAMREVFSEIQEG